MRTRTTWLLAALLALPVAAAAAQTAGGGQDAAAIRALVQEWNAAIVAKDTAFFRTIHAKDAIVLPPNGDMIEGQDAAVRMWAGLVAIPGLKLDVRPQDVVVSAGGDMAVETGTFTIEMDDAKGGGKISDAGKYVVVWRKTDGKWQVVRDIWNSSRPAPGHG